MDKQLIEGYLAGIGFIIVSLFLTITYIHMDLMVANNQIMIGLGAIFGILGIGSIIKPESIGQITAEWIRRKGSETGEPSNKKEKTVVVVQNISNVQGSVNTNVESVNSGNNSVEQPISVIDGEHHAKGKGNVIGINAEEPVFFKPGTKSIAEGEGFITATRIGKKSEREK